jgi:hypothetical protein
MRVLVVAPGSNIDNMADWVASARGHELTVLNGTVTTREALSAIASGRFQIVHFATHGCPTALEMSDGVIPEHMLADAFRAAGSVELAILGACESITLGARLYMACVSKVVSWRVAVDDRVAGVWANAFYSSLQLQPEIFNASQTASEAVRRLGAEPPIYLNGRLSVLEAELVTLRDQTQALQSSVQPHLASVAGAPRWLVLWFAAQALVTLALLAAQVAR